MKIRAGRSCRAVTATVVGAACVLVTASCGAPTPVVSNGAVSACYRALPVGREALHSPRARLIGVHRIPMDAVRDHLPTAVRTQLAAENDTAVCTMAFHGSFAPGQVEGADPAQKGDYALILVSSRHLHLVASVVLQRLPRAFGGRTF